MGGTFDRLHAAHERLLATAAKLAEEVFVGVVGETLGEQLFANKEHADLIEPFSQRQAAVREFLAQHTTTFEVGELTDPWGPAPKDPTADVIVVSNETKPAADRINQMRAERNLAYLDIVIVPWVNTSDGEILSSTLLRKREAESS